ncbi:hypothetical protein [Streptomyces sp. NRRL F-5630]|uniref:hypothetical protein n=1 Tax=Streptomyces sp. NRRL F-5630 TaxID=1463864 RepID=UPI000997C63E|nr:hypothetical protein [Streptomyces sp. NRRL F-5630]
MLTTVAPASPSSPPSWARSRGWAAKHRLTEAREAAKIPHDNFVDTAARYLRPPYTAGAHPTPEQEPNR